jgi:hypothetical protein
MRLQILPTHPFDIISNIFTNIISIKKKTFFYLSLSLSLPLVNSILHLCSAGEGVAPPRAPPLPLLFPFLPLSSFSLFISFPFLLSFLLRLSGYPYPSIVHCRHLLPHPSSNLASLLK